MKLLVKFIVAIRGYLYGKTKTADAFACNI